MELGFTKEKVEEIINWTLPGLTMYYRDTQLETEVIGKYKIGEVFRSQTFVDVSGFAGKLTKNCRFIFASSKAAPLYKINPATAKWQLHSINANSYFKVLDIYQKEGKTQIFCLHIPASGIDLFKISEFKIGENENDIEKQIIEKARISLDQKLNLETVKALEENEWLKRTDFPIGLDKRNDFFSLYPTEGIFKEGTPLYSAIRKMTNDISDINVPIIKLENNENKKSFWKRLFK